MKRGRKAVITEEDRQLWDQVRRTATPLRPEPPPEVAPASPSATPPKAPAAAKAGPPVAPPPVKAKPKPAPPKVGGIDRKTATRLSRGSVAIDARVDLHGMTQDAAHHRLLRFLEAARADGGKIVLVITGKGAPANHGPGESGRGVLRRVVPEWLRSAAFGSLVSGYENAGRRHGGEGALYVRLRRKRSPGERN